MHGGKIGVIAAMAVLVTACAGSPAGEDGAPGASPPPAAASPSPRAAGSTLVAAQYQPVWPFASPEEVRAWQDAYRENGREAWHLDPARTALAFTRDFLGFRGIDVITSRRVYQHDAHIGVGYRAEPGADPSTAAIVHLVRYGDGDEAPWEVVGTDDTTFTLTTPRYGATVSSPLTVGGRVTGVDESIRVTVLGRSARPLGEHCCLPAGGERRPWSAKLRFSPPEERDDLLTVVASTGGHVADVERFAITAVRPRR